MLKEMQMNNNLSYQYIQRLASLKDGELAILRTLQYKPLDSELKGFDLFTALWWPLREAGKHAPRREIAWLIAKLYASIKIPHKQDAKLSVLLGSLYYKTLHKDEKKADQIMSLNDKLLNLPIYALEPTLNKCLGLIKKDFDALDWVWLIDTISAWEVPSVRERWAEDFNNQYKAIS
jgi:hypothetical protein